MARADRRRRWLSGLAQSACAVALLLSATAADASPESEGLFDRGKRLMQDGKLDEACRALERSFELAPLGGTLLAMAICHEKQGRIATAYAELAQAAEVARSSDRPDWLEHALRSMEALRPRLPRLLVVAPRGAPPGLVIELDDRVLPAKELDVPVPVDPGARRVEWSGGGGVPGATTFEAREGVTTRIEVPWVQAGAGAEAPPAPEDGWDIQSTVAVAVGATGGVAIGLGGVLGGLALGKKSDSDDQCDFRAVPVRCTPAGVTDHEDGASLALGADIAFAAGAVLVGLAVAIYLWPTGDDEAATSRVRVRATATAGHAFFSVEGAVQ